MSDSSSNGNDTHATPELIGDLFVNDRGELINSQVELFTDPERGEVWQQWAARHLPVDVYRAFGMVEVEGSEEWLNVVEHNVFVAAAAFTVGKKLADAGVPVDLDKLVRSAIVHDAGKRLDVERKLSREAETQDKTFESVISQFGYSAEEINTAKNSGRLPDRYIQDPVERLRAVASHSIEANIVGYADARTRGSHVVGLEQAMTDSVMAKPKDEEFFTQNWRPYYEAVEGYFKALARDFDPAEITDDTVFETVSQSARAS